MRMTDEQWRDHLRDQARARQERSRSARVRVAGTSEETCVSCIWSQQYDPTHGDGGPDAFVLDCRRHPPTGQDGFPAVRGHDWCGEWEGPRLLLGKPTNADVRVVLSEYVRDIP